MTPGVVELIRDGFTIINKIRHRRIGGDSTWARIACSEQGEGIAFPFDDQTAQPCRDCWPPLVEEPVSMRVEWCEEHFSLEDEPGRCEHRHVTDCKIVRKLLVDDPRTKEPSHA